MTNNDTKTRTGIIGCWIGKSSDGIFYYKSRTEALANGATETVPAALTLEDYQEVFG